MQDPSRDLISRMTDWAPIRTDEGWKPKPLNEKAVEEAQGTETDQPE